jgi:hypothetical protein
MKRLILGPADNVLDLKIDPSLLIMYIYKQTHTHII